ncbi:MAG TPA: hypothetical protein V6C76_13360 [Drouetiella sp.]
MRTLRILTPLAISILSLTAYSFAITGSVKAQSERMILPPSKAVIPHKQLSIVPGPQSGIKLIEFISSRIHSLKSPVIANKIQYKQQKLQDEDSGPTDKFLALKPPTNTFVPRESTGGKDLKRESGEAKQSFYRSPRQIQIVDDRPAVRDFREAPPGAKADSESDDAAVVASNNVGNRRSLDALYKKRAEVSAAKPAVATNTYARTRAMPEGVKPLGQSIANLSGAMARTDGFMQAANDKALLASSSLKAKSASRQQISYQIASNSASNGVSNGIWDASKGFGNAQGRMSAAQNVPAPASAPAASAESGSDAQQAQNPSLPAVSYRHGWVAQPGDNQYSSGTAAGGGGAGQVKEYSKRGALLAGAPAQSNAEPAGAAGFSPPPPPQFDKNVAHGSLLGKRPTDLVAMLPPNVITGIPLVRLGSSAADANRALTSIKGNKVEKQNINGWTVFVMHKANSPDPAMHVYMRHGLVEALRIFDSGFIAPDFGVQLNDDLQVMKSKFGEPTFMVDEPECPKPARIHNYVYPISQVSFEVAQTSPTSPPKVVSILIFTVK